MTVPAGRSAGPAARALRRARVRAGLRQAAIGAALIGAALAVLVRGLNRRDESPAGGAAYPPTLSASNDPATAARVARGAYLARAGNCAGCHTARGGAAYAGGRAIATPFGTVHAPNLTPDAATGLGAWSEADFWRALHNGRSRDGRLLSPAFPYPQYTQVTRDDAGALYAFLRTLAPVAQPARAAALRFPFGSQGALAVWRALFFAPGVYAPDPAHSPAWNRGAYLVRGLGHCEACHTDRNALGGPRGPALAGASMPGVPWFAPALAPVAGGPPADPFATLMLLQTGRNARHAVLGPMADVVYDSTRHLVAADLQAIAAYLAELPPLPAPVADAAAAPGGDDGAVRRRQGATLYLDHCARCHGEDGEGAGNAYVPLAGSGVVQAASPANLVLTIVEGGYPPTTAGNPRPYGMPPFAGTLDDTQIAALATYLRGAWGQPGAAVSALDVARLR